MYSSITSNGATRSNTSLCVEGSHKIMAATTRYSRCAVGASFFVCCFSPSVVKDMLVDKRLNIHRHHRRRSTFFCVLCNLILLVFKSSKIHKFKDINSFTSCKMLAIMSKCGEYETSEKVSFLFIIHTSKFFQVTTGLYAICSARGYIMRS